MPERIIVSGIYRSGTSLTTKLVREWGAYAGKSEDLFEDDSDDNWVWEGCEITDIIIFCKRDINLLPSTQLFAYSKVFFIPLFILYHSWKSNLN